MPSSSRLLLFLFPLFFLSPILLMPPSSVFLLIHFLFMSGLFCLFFPCLSPTNVKISSAVLHDLPQGALGYFMAFLSIKLKGIGHANQSNILATILDEFVYRQPLSLDDFRLFVDRLDIFQYFLYVNEYLLVLFLELTPLLEGDNVESV